MKTRLASPCKSPWFTLIVLIILFPLIALTSAAQSSGPIINTCSSQVIDQEFYDTIEETVCLFGDDSQMSYSIDLNNDDADITGVPGLGARAEIAGYDGDFDWQNELGDSELYVSDSFTPIPNTIYTLHGWASDCVDPSNLGDTDNCQWNDDFADVQVQAQPTGTPPPPNVYAATAGIGQISLSWYRVPAATSYSVYEGTSSQGEGTTPIATGITGYNYVATGLTNGATYYFYVTASADAGESDPSNEMASTPQAAAATISLSSSANPAVSNTTVAFIAAVSSAAGTPTGNVTFYDGTTLLGTSTLSGFLATLSVNTLPSGSHSITATYQGNSQVQSVTSAPLVETINTSSGSCPVH